MEASMIERKYALVKIKSGDWLLPGNDGKTLWRLATYVDGPVNGLDIPRDREFWSVSKWDESYDWERIVNDPMRGDPLDWDYWEGYAGLIETRADAIQRALEME